MPIYCLDKGHCNMQLPFLARNTVYEGACFRQSKLPLLKNRFPVSLSDKKPGY